MCDFLSKVNGSELDISPFLLCFLSRVYNDTLPKVNYSVNINSPYIFYCTKLRIGFWIRDVKKSFKLNLHLTRKIFRPLGYLTSVYSVHSL